MGTISLKRIHFTQLPQSCGQTDLISAAFNVICQHETQDEGKYPDLKEREWKASENSISFTNKTPKSHFLTIALMKMNLYVCAWLCMHVCVHTHTPLCLNKYLVVILIIHIYLYRQMWLSSFISVFRCLLYNFVHNMAWSIGLDFSGAKYLITDCLYTVVWQSSIHENYKQHRPLHKLPSWLVIPEVEIQNKKVLGSHYCIWLDNTNN